MTDLHALLPQNKFETEKAQVLVALGYPAVEPILPELMEWIQDINWPIGLPLVPHIRQVFATNDEDWKMSALRRLAETSPDIFYAVREEIQRMADIQPQNEDEEALQEVAQEMLVHYSARQL